MTMTYTTQLLLERAQRHADVAYYGNEDLHHVLVGLLEAYRTLDTAYEGNKLRLADAEERIQSRRAIHQADLEAAVAREAELLARIEVQNDVIQQLTGELQQWQDYADAAESWIEELRA